MKTRILFVCLGNICRSPAAEGIMHRIVERRGLSGTFGIDSAGTYGGHRGELPDPRMQQQGLAPRLCADAPFAAGREEDFDRFDMIVAMGDMNYESLNRLAPRARLRGRFSAWRSSAAAIPTAPTCLIPTTRATRA